MYIVDLNCFFLYPSIDEEIGGNLGMAKFLETEEFKKMNVGLALDEGNNDIPPLPPPLTHFLSFIYELNIKTGDIFNSFEDLHLFSSKLTVVLHCKWLHSNNNLHKKILNNFRFSQSRGCIHSILRGEVTLVLVCMNFHLIVYI